MVVTDYNEQFLDKRGTDHLIEELKAYIDGISTGDIDLSSYVTKQELQAKLDALDINIDLSSYATKEELTEAINGIDLSSYALKTEIPSLDGYAKTSDIPTVPSKVSELENDSGYLTEHQDLSDYALKEEIPSLEGYATTEYVDNAVANIPSGGGGTTDLSNYYTKDEVYSKSETDALIPTVTDGEDGITPHIDSTTKHWMIGDTDTGIVAEGINGKDGKDGTNGTDGTDGVSPTVTVTKEGSVATITCTDVNGTTTATISDGKDGTSGGGSSSGGGNTDVYSTEETAIGTWIDGKTIYRKVIEVGTLPRITTGDYDYYDYVFSDTSVDQIISMSAILKYGANTHTCVHGSYNMIMLETATSVSKLQSIFNQNLVQLISTNGLGVRIYYGKTFGNYNCHLIVDYVK